MGLAGPHVAIAHGAGSIGVPELRPFADRWELSFVVTDAGDRMTELVASSAASLGHVVRVPPDAGAAAIVEELRPIRVDGVATFADDQLVRAAEVAAGLGLRYTPPQAARTIRSKHLQRVALNDAGLARVEAVYVPDPRRPPAELARLAPPVVVKPEHGAGSARTTFATTREAMDAALAAAAEPVVVEEAIRSVPHPVEWLGDYVSVDSVVANGEVRHAGICDRLPSASGLREAGFVVPSALPEETQAHLRETAERAIAALGIDNTMTHIEIKLSADGAGTVVEANPRLGGYVTHLFERTEGLSLPEIALAASCGRVALGPRAARDRVALAHVVLPPLDAEELVEAPSSDELRALGSVWRVDRYRRPGDRVDVAAGTPGRVLEIWLEAPDHERLRAEHLRLLDLLADRVSFR
jgi:biotin carboxylase